MTAPQSSSGSKRLVGLFTDLLGIGGVQQAGRLTSMALAEIARTRGWRSEFLSLNDPYGTHALPGCDKVELRGFSRNKPQFVLSALQQALGMETDGMVLAGHPNLALPAAWMRRLRPSLRTIVMSHGIEVWEPLAMQRRKALQRADRVLAPSGFTERRLQDVQGVAAQKVQRLPWPISAAFLAMASDPQRLPIPARFPRDGRIVLTVGRWAANERYKGADDLIRAIAALRASIPDIRLVAVGSGDDLPRLRAIASELHIEDRVQFLENLSNEQVAACYANCDVFALLSSGEGFGLVFLEAMAFGKPVVGLGAGGVTDIVRDGENGFLVTQGDPEHLSQAFQRLLAHASLRARFGAAGAEIVRRDYSFDAFRSRLAKIMDDCMSAAGPA